MYSSTTAAVKKRTENVDTLTHWHPIMRKYVYHKIYAVKQQQASKK